MSCRVLAAPCDRSTPPRVEQSACRIEPRCTHKPRLCGQPARFTASTLNVSTCSQPPPPMPTCARQSSAETHLEHASHQALSFFSPKSTSLPPPRCFSVGRSLAAATAHASRTVSARRGAQRLRPQQACHPHYVHVPLLNHLLSSTQVMQCGRFGARSLSVHTRNATMSARSDACVGTRLLSCRCPADAASFPCTS